MFVRFIVLLGAVVSITAVTTKSVRESTAESVSSTLSAGPSPIVVRVVEQHGPGVLRVGTEVVLAPALPMSATP